MINRLAYDHYLEEGTWEVVCDDCEDFIEVEAASFRSVIDQIKDLGWYITKEGNEFIHLCPDCR